jgi:galacturonosyltransferase
LGFFFHNEPNKKFFLDQNVVKGKTKLIPGSGVSLNAHCFEEYPSDDKNTRFLFIGRIMRNKGVDELFEAAQIIKASFPNTEFHFVGGKEEDYDDKLNELTIKRLFIIMDVRRTYIALLKNVMRRLIPPTMKVCRMYY